MRLDLLHADGVGFALFRPVFVPLLAVMRRCNAHDVLEGSDDLFLLQLLRRGDHVAKFGAARRFHDHAVAFFYIKFAGVKIVHFAAVLKSYADYGLHWFVIASDISKKSLSATARSVSALAPAAYRSPVAFESISIIHVMRPIVKRGARAATASR